MKFFLLLVLSFAVIFGFTTANNSTTVQWDPNNQQLVNILNTGLEEAVAEAIQSEQILNCKYNWTKVTSVENCNMAGMTSYSFSVLVGNNCLQDELLFDLSLIVDNDSGDIEINDFHIMPL